jgi:GTPase SAR1 family protein
MYYFEEKEGIVFVVDSSDSHRMAEAKKTLHFLMQEEMLRGCLLCVVANKRDNSDAMPLQDIYYALDMDAINREKIILEASAYTGTGVLEILDWFSENVRFKTSKEKKEEKKEEQRKQQEEEQAAVAKQREMAEQAAKKKKEKEMQKQAAAAEAKANA